MKMAIYFFIGLLIKTFEVIVISVVNFLVTYLVSKILKTNDISHPSSCFIIMSILLTSQPGRLYKICCELVKSQ